MKGTKMLLGCALLAASLVAGNAQAQTTLRMTWYSDGNEGEVMTDLLERFEEQNKDIKVVLDQVPFKAINENLPVQLAAGQGPDIARVADLGGVARYMLDLRPYLKDPAYWETNFGPFLDWMRLPGDTTSIPGFMTQLTVTGPFVNKTLFEQAGVADAGRQGDLGRLGEGREGCRRRRSRRRSRSRSTARATASSASRSSQGAKLFDAKGEPAVVDDGFKTGGAARLRLAQDRRHVEGALGLGGGHHLSRRQRRVQERPGRDVHVGLLADRPVRQDHRQCLRLGRRAQPLAARRLHRHAGRRRPRRHQDDPAPEGSRAGDGISRERDRCCANSTQRTLFVPGHLGLAKQGHRLSNGKPRRRPRRR